MLKWLEVVSFLFRVTWVFNRVVMTRLELEEAELHKEKKTKNSPVLENESNPRPHQIQRAKLTK
jgi:hypothetical protein